MKEKTKGKLFVVLILAVASMSLGCICGMSNIGDDVSKIILPVSLSQPDDKINVISENPEKLNEISIEEPETQNTTINPTKNENIIDKNINKNITTKPNKTNNNTTVNNKTSNDTQNTTPKELTPIKDTKNTQNNNEKVSLTSQHDTKKVKKQTNDSK